MFELSVFDDFLLFLLIGKYNRSSHGKSCERWVFRARSFFTSPAAALFYDQFAPFNFVFPILRYRFKKMTFFFR